jgi:hypothetical protein
MFQAFSNMLRLRFRISRPGFALNPHLFKWDTGLFTPTLHHLPGLVPSEYLNEVSYPRFVCAEKALLLSWRIGKYVHQHRFFFGAVKPSANVPKSRSRI